MVGMKSLYLIGISLLAVACERGSHPPDQPDIAKEASAATMPVVTDNASDLLFRYRVDGAWRQALTIADIPAEARKQVQVVDLAAPPSARNASATVFLFDLTSKGSGGQYPGQAIARKELEARMRSADAPVQASKIIMYSTSWCGVCTRARSFMKKNGVAFVEKDVEKDRQAAAELAKKKRAQGINSNGVPVFDISGKLLPGFDPNRLLAMAKATPQGEKTK